MSCVLKLSVAKTPSGGQIYLVDPDHANASAADRRLSRNPRIRAAAEAEELLASARSEAEKIRLEALERGYRDGQEQAAAENEQMKRQAEEFMEAVQADRDAFFARIEPKVVKLAVEVAEKILRHQVSAQPEVVLEIAKSALSQLRDDESVKLRVNPEDAALVKANKDELDKVRQSEIVEDRRVERGGCVAESPGGKLDAQIKTQISQVTRIFAEAASDDAGDAESSSA